MDFYYGRISGNSARAAFGIFETCASVTAHLVDTRSGEHRAPEYLAVNPVGKVPALADGAYRLWESNAINWYVAEKFPSARLLPTSIEGRASVQRWMFFQVAHVYPSCVALFRTTNRRSQAFWGVTGDANAAAVALTELARWLPVLERGLEGRDWLEGEFSLADIAYAPHFYLIEEGDFDFSPYPRVHAWLKRLEARPAWQKTVDLVFSA
jgi:glutathione S-transferase